jgi:serine O-acetyltransferase
VATRIEAAGAESDASSGAQVSLNDLVDGLCATQDQLVRPQHPGAVRPLLPSRDSLVRSVHELRSVLFPGYFERIAGVNDEALRFHVGATLDRLLGVLQEQVKRGLCFACEAADPRNCPQCDERARLLTMSFLGRLPEVRRLLATDVQAAYEGDPAAGSVAETILCYPGIFALTCQRLAHELHQLGVPLLPRIITEHAHSVTGIDIHPGAQIGERFFIDHGTGVVIGETCVIGRNVRLYQGVTLGARSFPLDASGNPVKGRPRHPIIEDDVMIYSGATVLGRIRVGAGSIIGGNVWLTKSVPPRSRVAQVEVRQVEYAGGGGI